ncbi:hypothetical protein LZG74_07190 [Dyadobacter sp. CY327]|uniref:DUF6934 family protein n=1 Tax=Dyadobacter sp. CY327 TaxID=2907301 RepID=UPI001F231E7C|nr:hypothetical protein [Dyadobacter sp. CY327]MCE7070077.1 hypothetical protein [Dyadobacter sp. CY327]
MDKPFYQFTVLNEAKRFDFLSIGKKSIPKTIQFHQTNRSCFFMLVLADLAPDDLLDTQTISNNGDMQTILATVFKAVDIFLAENPAAVVVFSGSNEARTRLYQIAIARELLALRERFNILGMANDEIEVFCKGKRYEAFLISLKNINVEQFI